MSCNFLKSIRNLEQAFYFICRTGHENIDYCEAEYCLPAFNKTHPASLIFLEHSVTPWNFPKSEKSGFRLFLS